MGQTNDVSPEWLEFCPQNKTVTVDVHISLSTFLSFGCKKCSDFIFFVPIFLFFFFSFKSFYEISFKLCRLLGDLD